MCFTKLSSLVFSSSCITNACIRLEFPYLVCKSTTKTSLFNVILLYSQHERCCRPYQFISSPEPKAHMVSLKYGSRANVRACVSVCVSTLSNLNISPTSGPITTIVYLKHHWGGRKTALGFWPDRIRTLVSMATYSSQRVIMRKILGPL